MGELASQEDQQIQDPREIRDLYPEQSQEFERIHACAWTPAWWDQEWDYIQLAAHTTMQERDPDHKDPKYKYACPVCKGKFRGLPTSDPNAPDPTCDALYSHLLAKAGLAMHPLREQVKAWDKFWK